MGSIHDREQNNQQDKKGSTRESVDEQARPLDNVVKLVKPDFCDIYYLYNAIQYSYKEMLIIDIRDESSFIRERVFDSINIEFDKFYQLINDRNEIDFINGLQAIFWKIFRDLGQRQKIETIMIIPDKNMGMSWTGVNYNTNDIKLNKQLINQRLILIRNIQKFLQTTFKQNSKVFIVDQPFIDIKEKFPFLCFFSRQSSFLNNNNTTKQNETETKENENENENKNKHKNSNEQKTDSIISTDMENMINIPKTSTGSINHDVKTKSENKNENENANENGNEKESKSNETIGIVIESSQNAEKMAQRYKYPAQILNDKLFLGNWTHGNNETILKHLSITHIVNVTPDVTTVNSSVYKKSLQISLNDSETEDILSEMDKICEFIHDALTSNINHKVLVHCRAGVSRSCTAVCAYLIKHRHMAYKEAIAFCLERRPIVDPNKGFVKQLQKFDKMCHDE